MVLYRFVVELNHPNFLMVLDRRMYSVNQVDVVDEVDEYDDEYEYDDDEERTQWRLLLLQRLTVMLT